MSPRPEAARVARQNYLGAWWMRKVALMTVDEVAAQLGIKPRAAADWIKRGRSHAKALAFREIGCDPRYSPSLRSAIRPPVTYEAWL